MGVSDRVKFIRKTLQLSQTEFAKLLQVGQAAISQIERGENKPSFDLLESLYARLNVSSQWLISGVGEPYVIPSSTKTELKLELPAENLNLPQPKRSPSAVLPEARAQHQHGTNVAGRKMLNAMALVNQQDERSEWLNDAQLQTKQQLLIPSLPGGGRYLAIRVSGDAMSPTIDDGDIVICRLLTHLDDLQKDTLYMVNMKQGEGTSLWRLTAKEAANLLTLSADNPAYSQRRVEQAAIDQAWQVIFRLTDHIPSHPNLNDQFIQLSKKLTELTHRVESLESGQLKGSATL